jgi:hypothetical protein
LTQGCLLRGGQGNAMVPRPKGLVDEEDDWEEMAQLEGLGQGGSSSLGLASIV